MNARRRPPLTRRWWTWPLIVIAVGVMAGVVASAAGLGFGREPRTLFSVDACPEPPAPPTNLVAAAVTASWQPDVPAVGVQPVAARLSSDDLGAYGRLGACQRGQVSVDAALGGGDAYTGPRLGELPGGRRELRTSGREGRVVIAERLSAQQSVPDYGANDFAGFTGWYLTAVDPAPGTYRWTTPVTWQASPDAPAEPGTLVVELTVG